MAAGFRIEGGLAEDDLRLLALGRLLDGRAVHQETHDHRWRGCGVVAQEAGSAQAKLLVDAGGVKLAAEARRGAGAFLLFLHLSLEAFHVYCQAVLAGDLGGYFNREAVGVVEKEEFLP